MSYEATGTIIEITPVMERSATFKTREFVIEKTENSNGRVFTDYIKFQAVQDRTALLDNFKVGDVVKVTFNLKGNKWERDGKVSYFTNLDAWRVEKAADAAGGDNYPPPPDNSYVDELPETNDADSNDLPF